MREQYNKCNKKNKKRHNKVKETTSFLISTILAGGIYFSTNNPKNEEQQIGQSQNNDTEESSEVVYNDEEKPKEMLQIDNTEEILDKEVNSAEEFGELIKKHIDLTQIPKHSTIGRFLRTMRYYNFFNEASVIFNDISDYNSEIINVMIALCMQESYGDPTEPNSTNDGGAGLCHIQNPAIKQILDYTLRTPEILGNFDDIPDIYKELPKNYESANIVKKELNQFSKSHEVGEELKKKIKEYNRNIHKLSQIDIRFNNKHNILLSTAYVKWLFQNYIKPNYESSTQGETREKLKNTYGNKVLQYLLSANCYRYGPQMQKCFGLLNNEALYDEDAGEIRYYGSHGPNIQKFFATSKSINDRIDNGDLKGKKFIDILNALDLYPQTPEDESSRIVISNQDRVISDRDKKIENNDNNYQVGITIRKGRTIETTIKNLNWRLKE